MIINEETQDAAFLSALPNSGISVLLGQEILIQTIHDLDDQVFTLVVTYPFSLTKVLLEWFATTTFSRKLWSNEFLAILFGETKAFCTSEFGTFDAPCYEYANPRLCSRPKACGLP